MRRLLTILAADIAGYSKHVEHDEKSTLQQLEELRGLMDPIIKTHSGVIANTAGDSVLAYFGSPVEAVESATAIQAAHYSHNEAVLPEKRLQFRIGLNIGDVSIQPNGDILGHGVNVAARLEQLAEPGSICLSENVMDQVTGKLQLEFTKVGEHRVKNLKKPISVYSVGSSSFPFLRKSRKLISSVFSSPLGQFGFTAMVAIGAGISFWALAINEAPPRGPSNNLDDLNISEMSAEDLIEHFEPVSVGHFEGKKYLVVQTWGGRWDQIEEISKVLGGHPVAINSEEENQFVYELTLKNEVHWQTLGGIHAGPTIGLIQSSGSDEPSGGWAWSNGEVLGYENWKRYGPDNYGGEQSLARFGVAKDLRPGPTWNDVDSVQHAFVVEIP